MTMDINTRDTDLFGHRSIRREGVAQLALPLGWCRGGTPTGFADILIGPSNELAARHIQNVKDWTTPAMILVGPRGSGKSLFARMFVAAGAGDAVDDLECADESAVFHAWNRAQVSGGRLLITAASGDDPAMVRLPDLRTRLASAPVLVIGEPDLSLSAALIERLLAQRGYAPTPQIARYAAERIVRTYAAIHALIDAIDNRAMADGRMLTVHLVRDAIGDLSGMPQMVPFTTDEDES